MTRRPIYAVQNSRGTLSITHKKPGSVEEVDKIEDPQVSQRIFSELYCLQKFLYDLKDSNVICPNPDECPGVSIGDCKDYNPIGQISEEKWLELLSEPEEKLIGVNLGLSDTVVMRHDKTVSLLNTVKMSHDEIVGVSNREIRNRESASYDSIHDELADGEKDISEYLPSSETQIYAIKNQKERLRKTRQRELSGDSSFRLHMKIQRLEERAYKK